MRLCAALCCCSKCRADSQHSPEAPRRPDLSALGDEEGTGGIRTDRWCYSSSGYRKCVLQAEPVRIWTVSWGWCILQVVLEELHYEHLFHGDSLFRPSPSTIHDVNFCFSRCSSEHLSFVWVDKSVIDELENVWLTIKCVNLVELTVHFLTSFNILWSISSLSRTVATFFIQGILLCCVMELTRGENVWPGHITCHPSSLKP